MTDTYEILKQEMKKYLTENHFTDVILGLSGGMDSAFVAVLAADALGSEHVYTLMMKTKYTSEESLQIARELAQINNIHYAELDIQKQVDTSICFLKENFKEEPCSIVLENIQARIRGEILMSYSNQYNYLPLACSNASEVAMGYCTLYGDTCGGISPIGNVYKSDLYKLAAKRQEKGNVFPAAVLTRAPTAELAFNQKDENTLPPYPILDAILKAYINQKQTQEQIISQGFNSDLVHKTLARYHAMSFKRKQLPPALPLQRQR